LKKPPLPKTTLHYTTYTKIKTKISNIKISLML
jgi:hypothetical protein